MNCVSSKKGDIQSQLFTYILTVVIIGLLLFLSTKWIGDLIEQEKQMEFIRFKTSLENTFERIAPEHGSYEYVDIIKPSSVGKVCFIDPDKYNINAGLCHEGDSEYSPKVCDIWEEGNSKIVVEKGYTDINLPDIEIQSVSGYICFDEDNIKIKLQGMGNKVIISNT